MRARHVFLTALSSGLLWGTGCTGNDLLPAERVPLVTGETVDIDTSFGRVPTLVVRGQTWDRTREVSPALIVGLHGYGIDERQIATLLAIDPAFDHVYIAPRGFYELNDGSRGWFPIKVVDGQPVIDPEELRRCLDRTMQYLDAAAQQAHTDPDQVYVIGYSQGGVLAVTMAMTHPTAARGYAAFAGSIHAEAWPMLTQSDELGQTRLFIGHGTLDGFTSMASMRNGAIKLNAHGLKTELREYHVPHVVSNAQRRDVRQWLETLSFD